MIDLGIITVREHEAITDVRRKILGLALSLHCNEVLATRAATAVSEAARRRVEAGGELRIRVEIVGDDRALRLRLLLDSRDGSVDPEPLRQLFDHVTSTGTGLHHTIAADLGLPASAAGIGPDLIRRERLRIARKSRHELLEELQLKNRQLEDYNQTLEATVAQRTAQLQDANRRLQTDLDAGAAYVRALIPPPVSTPVRLDWRYVPSSNLGGDTIGYHWLDEDHLALYLLDVTGHGLDSALLAVTVTNVIRAGSLRGTDMRRPDQVIASLNDAFQGENHGQKYFTIWYGVYQASSRVLTWSGGGHHPAILLPRDETQPVLLPSSGPIMGAVPGMPFPSESCTVPPAARLLIFSDGVFEILREGTLVWSLDGVNAYLTSIAQSRGSLMDELLDHVHSIRGSTQLDDDVSIIEATFA